MQRYSSLRTALASAACLATFAIAAPALAQGYGPPPYSAGPTESVIVTAPRFRAETAPLNGPIEKLSLSIPVHYRTRDLLTPWGVRALRRRVRRTAAEVCGRLAQAYPVYTSTSSPPCFREAYNSAMAKIDARIAGARLESNYGP